MQQPENVAIFWDYENCPPTSALSVYEVVDNIRCISHTFGSVVSFKAYLEIAPTSSSKPVIQRSELQASGVSLIDCPHNGRKDVADKMLIVDMIAYAIDHPAPTTIILISGDRDYAYAVSTMRMRRYRVVVVCPSNAHASLIAQASVHLDWNAEVLGQTNESPPPQNGPNSRPPSTPRRRRASSTASRASHSVSKGPDVADIEDLDDDMYGPRYESYHPNDYTPGSTRVNGHDDEYTPRYPERSEPPSGRQTPVVRATSRATSRPYSPPGSFRSAKSSLPTPPLAGPKTTEPTFVTAGINLFPSASKPNIKGFSFNEPEHITPKKRPSEDTTSFSFSQGAGFQPATKEPEVLTPPVSIFPADSAPVPVLAPSRPFTFFGALAAPATAPTPTVIPAAGLRESPVASSIPPTTAATTPPPAPAPAPVPAPAPAPPSVPVPASEAPAPAPTPPVVSVSAVPTPAPTLAPAPAFIPKPPVVSAPPTPTPTYIPKPPAAIVTTSGSAQAPITPATTSRSSIPLHFKALIDTLEVRRLSRNQPQVVRSEVGTDLSKHKSVYKLAGVSSFAAYIDLAEKAGIVQLGGIGNSAWISLRPEWRGSTLA